MSWFSETLPEPWLDLLTQDSVHPIYEVLAVAFAFTAWEKQLCNTYTVAYVDNQAALGALVAGTSNTNLGAKIVDLCLDVENRGLLRPWFSWVPTHSNPADPPSRGETGGTC